MLLAEKVVIISGVGPGLGRALAEIAAAEGAKVVLAARNATFLEEVKAGIERRGGTAAAVACDISDAEDCGRLARSAAALFGDRIDGLVNSAYRHGQWGGVESADEADWSRDFDVNCLGALRLSKAVVPFMKTHGGAIVNVSTMATVRPYGDQSGMEMSYGVSKGALNVLGKYMAADLGKHGIRVNTCRMGWLYGAPVQQFIRSQVDLGRSEAEVTGAITQDIPLGVIPPQEECAKSILMLLSDYARMVTGAVLDVNGGHWMAP